jgi:MFS family permease
MESDFVPHDAMEGAQIPRETAALLRALRFRGASARDLSRLTEEEWQALLPFCENAHLTFALAQLRVDGVPAWVAERLERNVADNALRYERVKATYREAALALEQAGVDHIVIKGFTQAPEYVADPRLRMQSDIDFVVRPEQVALAQAALESIGYRPDKNCDTRTSDHTQPMIRCGDWQWRGNAFDPSMPLSIELHFCLWNENTALFRVPEVQHFWERKTLRTIDEMEFHCLHPVDHLGHLCLHILRNVLSRGPIVHHVYELATFLHTYAHDDDLWRSWSTLHTDSMRAKEVIALYHAHLWFRCDLHPLVRQQFEALPPQQSSWLEHFGASSFEGMFRENKDSFWLHLSLIRPHVQKLLLLRRTFFPNVMPDPAKPAIPFAARAAGTRPKAGLIRYVTHRTLTYTQANLLTLSRGLRWQLQRHRLPRQFWIFLAASFFFDLGLSIYFFLFNLFLIGHGYTEKTLGLIAGAMAMGSFAGAIPAAGLARRFGLRAALVLAFVVGTLIFGARALLLAPPVQLGLAFASGLILSIWAVCISPAVANLTTERQRPFAFSLVFSLGIGVGALGGLFGGRLPGWIERHASAAPASVFADPLRLVLLLACGLVALGLWPAMRLTFEKVPAVPSHARPSFVPPFLLRFLPAIAVWGIVTGSFSPFANVYFAEHLRMPLPQVGNAFSASQAMQVIAVLAAPLLLRRLGLVNGIVFTQLAAAVFLCVLAAIHNPLAGALGYMAFTAFQWMNEPGLYSLLMDRVPEDQREGAAAANSLVMSASQALAAVLAGSAFARFGYPVPMLCIAAIAVVAACLFRGLVHAPQPRTVLKLDRVAE